MPDQRSITVRLNARLEVWADDLIPMIAAPFLDALTTPNPAHTGKKGSSEPRLLEHYQRIGDWIIAPRGSLMLLRDLARRQGRKLVVDSAGVVSRRREDLALSWIQIGERLLRISAEKGTTIQIRRYQRQAIECMLRAVQGVLIIPCGGGKTFSALIALLRTGEPCLILVHTIDLLDQWEETARMLAPDRTIRTIRGEPKRVMSPLTPGEICIAMIPTMSTDPRAQHVLRSTGAVCFDEAHHISAITWRGLLPHLPARYRWGVTATPDREDGQGPLLNMAIGDEVFRITTRELIDQGYLQEPRVIPVVVPWMPGNHLYPREMICPYCQKKHKLSPVEAEQRARMGTRCSRETCKRLIPSTLVSITTRPIEYGTAVTEMCESAAWQDEIMRIALCAHQHHRMILVLVPRVAVGPIIAERLEAAGIPTRAISSRTAKGKRRAAFADARAGTVRAIVATTLADEGLDLPGVDCLIQGLGGRAAGRAIQRVGRSLRLAGKPPVVYELIAQASCFIWQWRRRRKVYFQEYGRDAVLHMEPIDTARGLLAMMESQQEAAAQ